MTCVDPTFKVAQITAQFTAQAAQLDPDLLAIIDAWPTLTPAIRAKLLKLIREACA
jgi:hypothetical protein